MSQQCCNAILRILPCKIAGDCFLLKRRNLASFKIQGHPCMALFFKIDSCSSGKCLLAGRFGKNNMSLEGKCRWEIENSVCLMGLAESKTNIYTCKSCKRFIIRADYLTFEARRGGGGGGRWWVWVIWFV